MYTGSGLFMVSSGRICLQIAVLAEMNVIPFTAQRQLQAGAKQLQTRFYLFRPVWMSDLLLCTDCCFRANVLSSTLHWLD